MLSAVFMKAQTIGEIKFYLNNNYFFTLTPQQL